MTNVVSRLSAILYFACAVMFTASAPNSRAADRVMTHEQSAAAIAALAPLKAFAGEFDSKIAYGPMDKAEHTGAGAVTCRMRSGGFAFTIEKHQDATDFGPEYDDFMVFTYNPTTEKVEAILYQAGNLPRHINVDVTEKKLVLNYEPLKNGDATVTTREEISLEDAGAVRWQVKRPQAPGTFNVVLEVLWDAEEQGGQIMPFLRE